MSVHKHSCDLNLIPDVKQLRSVCVCRPAGPVSPRPVSPRPLPQPQLSGADPRTLPGVVPLESEEPDYQDPAGEQVSSLWALSHRC